MPPEELCREATAETGLAERRLTTRFAVDWPAEVVLNDATRRPVRIVNVSIGGVQVESEKPLGRVVSAEVHLNSYREPVDMHWPVSPVWAQRRNGRILTGLRFQDLPADEQTRLKSVLGVYLSESAPASG